MTDATTPEARSTKRLFIFLCIIWTAVIAAAFGFFRYPGLASDASLLAEAAPFVAFALAPPAFLVVVQTILNAVEGAIRRRNERAP